MQIFGITMEGVIEKEDIKKGIEDLFEEELQLRISAYVNIAYVPKRKWKI